MNQNGLEGRFKERNGEFLLFYLALSRVSADAFYNDKKQSKENPLDFNFFM
jgi:hypothetical protein